MKSNIIEQYIIEQIEQYNMQSCIDMFGCLSTDINNLITGENASLSMTRVGVSNETYKEVIERNLIVINEMLKCVLERIKELNKPIK